MLVIPRNPAWLRHERLTVKALATRLKTEDEVVRRRVALAVAFGLVIGFAMPSAGATALALAGAMVLTCVLS